MSTFQKLTGLQRNQKKHDTFSQLLLKVTPYASSGTNGTAEQFELLDNHRHRKEKFCETFLRTYGN